MSKSASFPELDEEFAQGIGEGYDSLEALREQVEEELKTEFENTAEQELRQNAIDSLLEARLLLLRR